MAFRVSDLVEAVRLLSEEVEIALEPHLLPEELNAYLEGRVSAAESSRITEHLTLCPLCLGVFVDWQRAFEEQVLTQPDEEWERFRQQLAQRQKALQALDRLADRRQHLPLIDAVEVVRAIRSEDENREAD